MKTYRNLYPQIATFSNLLLAFDKARKGKRGKTGVAIFEYNLEQELLRLWLWPASRRATHPARSGEQPYGTERRPEQIGGLTMLSSLPLDVTE